MKYRELYEEGRQMLAEAGIEEAALDARLLLEKVCGTDRNALLVHGEDAVDEKKELDFRALVESRKQRIPLQQITGEQEFMGLRFVVDENVLIPRQDTEILVEEVLRILQDGERILDMCTGSGCILISLLHYSNNCQGVGVDLSAKALAVAGENAKTLLGENPFESEAAKEEDFPYRKWELLQSDLFQKVTGKFDVIVSNPPYIPSKVVGTLMPEVREHEPQMALDGGDDGLDFYRRIVTEGRNYLFRGGKMYLEIGYDQAKDVQTLMEQAGFCEVTVVKDYAGLDRVVHGILLPGAENMTNNG